MSKLTHFANSRFTDGGEVVSIHFCERSSRLQGHGASERLRNLKPKVG
jgi:hypothetical protein